MTEALLVLNAGSSSIKFALYACVQLLPLCRGHIDALGTAELPAGEKPERG